MFSQKINGKGHQHFTTAPLLKGGGVAPTGVVEDHLSELEEEKEACFTSDIKPWQKVSFVVEQADGSFNVTLPEQAKFVDNGIYFNNKIVNEEFGFIPEFELSFEGEGIICLPEGTTFFPENCIVVLA